MCVDARMGRSKGLAGSDKRCLLFGYGGGGGMKGRLKGIKGLWGIVRRQYDEDIRVKHCEKKR